MEVRGVVIIGKHNHITIHFMWCCVCVHVVHNYGEGKVLEKGGDHPGQGGNEIGHGIGGRRANQNYGCIYALTETVSEGRGDFRTVLETP